MDRVIHLYNNWDLVNTSNQYIKHSVKISNLNFLVFDLIRSNAWPGPRYTNISTVKVYSFGYCFSTDFCQQLFRLNSLECIHFIVHFACSLLQLVPESPRFLMTVGKPEKALRILQRIAEENKQELPPGELVATEKHEVFLTYHAHFLRFDMYGLYVNALGYRLLIPVCSFVPASYFVSHVYRKIKLGQWTRGMKHRTSHFSQFSLLFCYHRLCCNSKTWDTITDFSRHCHRYIVIFIIIIFWCSCCSSPSLTRMFLGQIVPRIYFQVTFELWDWLGIVILFRLLKRNHSDTTEKYKKPSLTNQSRLLFAVFDFRLHLCYALLQYQIMLKTINFKRYISIKYAAFKCLSRFFLIHLWRW